MPTVRIDNPELLPSLLEDLQRLKDVVAEPTGDNTILVSILGSYNTEGMRLATYLRIRAWEAAQRARGMQLQVELE